MVKGDDGGDVSRSMMLVRLSPELRTCHPGYFQCGSGHCIAERFKCDGNPDCLDYTDETSCRECLSPDRSSHADMGNPNVPILTSQRRASPTAPTAPPSCSSARTTCACSLNGNATATTTAGTVRTRSFTCAVGKSAPPPHTHQHSRHYCETRREGF